MIKIVFAIAGLVSSIHVYSYGRWLKQQGNIAGSLLAFLFAVAAVILPVYRMMK